MTMLQNEVAADNQRRMFDQLPRSPAGQLLEAVGEIVAPIGTVLRLKDRILGLGVPTLEENLNYLGAATEEAFTRIERKQEIQYDELQKRLESREFQDALAAAVLQTQRTSQKPRLKRMAFILANGVAVNDLGPESLDDMLRAAVELRYADIFLLQKLYKSQVNIVDQVQRMKGQSPDKWHQDIQVAWKSFINSGGLNPQDHLDYRSSFSRLESFGLIQKLDIPSWEGVGTEMYALLSEGKKFCERVKEIELD